MIYHYGTTQQGTYHVEKGIVCQDAHNFKLINEHFAIAAVADGLGSESHSDIASQTAVKISVEYCATNIQENDSEEKILSTIKESFSKSLEEINKIATSNNDEVDQYDTTLVVVAYINGDVYFGNAGDSGIVVLNKNGKYESLTTQQRDEDGHVFPLWFGEEKWVFGHRENVASVFMATDGMYETLFPFLLKGTDNPLYVALAHYMMSDECVGFTKEPAEEVQQKMESFIANIPGNQVNDDKTVLVMYNSNIIPEKLDDDYYKAPDWVALKKKHDEEYRRLAYPNMYKEENKE